MRVKNETFLTILFALLLMVALPALPALAEEDSDDEAVTSIEADIAVYGTHKDKDSSKAEEYGEVPHGFTINYFDAKVTKGDRFLNLSGTRVGLNNAKYLFDYGVFGDYKLYVNYYKIPHLFSKDGMTNWTELEDGQWRIADSVQGAIEGLNPADPGTPGYSITPQHLFIKDWLLAAHSTPLGLQRNQTDTGIEFTPGSNWKYDIKYFLENRDGTRPFGTSFGFSWVTELPEHIDYKTHRFHAGAEWAKNGRSFNFAYDLSLFENATEVMIWDNPLRLNDRTYSSAYSPGDGTSQGRTQLPSDNIANQFSFGGATKLGKGRLSGSFAYSKWTDDVNLLPFTINTAIEEIPLPSNTFNGDLSNLNIYLRYTVPLGNSSNFNASYRLYDQNNNSDQFNIGEYVRFDQVEEELERFECDAAGNCTAIENPLTHLIEFRTQTFDLDYGWSSKKFSWHAAYIFDRWDREERDAHQVDTNSFKTYLDTFATDRLTFRVSYQYSQRRADEFEVDNPTYVVVPLTRRDVADVNRNLFKVQADLMASDKASLGFSFALDDMDFLNTVYGTLDWKTYSVGADFSYAMTDRQSFNIFYEHGYYNSNQIGRQSGGTPEPTTSTDWTAENTDDFDTVGAGFHAYFVDQKGSWDTTLTYARANGKLDIMTGTTLRPTGAESLFNADDTDWLQFKTGFTWQCMKRTKIQFGYWLDYYTIDDFAEDTSNADQILIPTATGFTTAGILLNAIQPDYTYHTGYVGLIYSW